MADITLCLNEKCPLKGCKRKTLRPSNFFQSYSFFQYKDDACDFYLE